MATYYWVDKDKKQSGVVDDPTAVGLNAHNLYEEKHYAGGKMQLMYNNLNSEWYPRQGVRWITEGTALQPLNKYAAPLTKLTSTLDVFAPLTKEARVIAELHLGGGHIFSNRYEYFQALTIGGDTYMYGFPPRQICRRIYGLWQCHPALKAAPVQCLCGQGRSWYPGLQ